MTKATEILAITNNGPILKGREWALIERMPAKTREVIKREVRAAIATGQEFTAIRPLLPGEIEEEYRFCRHTVGVNVKKAGDIQMCWEPATMVRYWIHPGAVAIGGPNGAGEGRFMGEETFCSGCVEAGLPPPKCGGKKK